MADLRYQCPSTGCFHIPSWSDFVDVYLFWPTVSQFVITVVLFLLHPVYKTAYYRCAFFRLIVVKYIGSPKIQQVKKPAFHVILYFLQVVFSLMNTFIFIYRTYTRNRALEEMERILSGFFAIHYFVLRFKNEFHASSCWKVGAFIDNLTIIPVLFPYDRRWVRVPSGDMWLSLGYLRAYRAFLAYYRLEKTVDFEAMNVSNVSRVLVMSMLKIFCMIVLMGGTIMIVEILGPFNVAWMQSDNFIEPLSGFGSISFVQMSYWIVTTVSTVGYGDFSPQTELGRVIISVFIFVGLGIFSNEITNVMEVKNANTCRNARRFTPDAENYRFHVVLVGGGVGTFSNTMETFLSDMLTVESRAAAVPDVVLLSDTEFDPLLIRFVQKDIDPRVVSKVHLLQGDSMIDEDLKRANVEGADMVLVIPDVYTDNPQREDHTNIIRCLRMREYFEIRNSERVGPKRQFSVRLMLLLPESRTVAELQGVRREHCFSAHEIKAKLFAQSTYVRGLIPFLSGLLQVTSQNEIDTVLRHLSAENQLQNSSWFQEYMEGLKWNIYGFVVRKDHEGKKFSDFASQVYQESDGNVLPFGVLDRDNGSRLCTNFGGRLQPSQIVTVISASQSAFAPFKSDTEERDWRIVASAQGALANMSQGSDNFRHKHLENLSKLGTFEATIPKFRRRSLSDENMDVVKDTKLDANGSAKEAQSEVQESPQDEGFPKKSETRSFRHQSTAADLMGPSASLHYFKHRAAHKIKESSNSICVVIVGQNLWQQVVALLRSLRVEYLPEWHHVIVLSSDEPPQAIRHAFDGQGTTFMHGNLRRPGNLMAAGILESHTVLVVRGDGGISAATEGGSSGTVAGDADLIILAGVLNQLFLGSPAEPLRIQEFSSTNAVALVGQNRWKSFFRCPTFAEELRNSIGQGGGVESRVLVLHKEISGASGHVSFRWGFKDQVRRLWNSVKKPFVFWMKLAIDVLQGDESFKDVESAIVRQLLFNPTFAAGKTFTSDFFGGMMGRAFHLPVTVELIEELTRSTATQGFSVPWQVAVPPAWVQESFGDLVQAWLQQTDVSFQGAGPAIVLGIYRTITAVERLQKRGSDGAYWVTMPDRCTRLRETDLITVLCTQDFIDRAEELGLTPKLRSEELHCDIKKLLSDQAPRHSLTTCDVKEAEAKHSVLMAI